MLLSSDIRYCNDAKIHDDNGDGVYPSYVPPLLSQEIVSEAHNISIWGIAVSYAHGLLAW